VRTALIVYAAFHPVEVKSSEQMLPPALERANEKRRIRESASEGSANSQGSSGCPTVWRILKRSDSRDVASSSSSERKESRMKDSNEGRREGVARREPSKTRRRGRTDQSRFQGTHEERIINLPDLSKN